MLTSSKIRFVAQRHSNNTWHFRDLTMTYIVTLRWPVSILECHVLFECFIWNIGWMKTTFLKNVKSSIKIYTVVLNRMVVGTFFRVAWNCDRVVWGRKNYVLPNVENHWTRGANLIMLTIILVTCMKILSDCFLCNFDMMGEINIFVTNWRFSVFHSFFF